MDTTGKVAGSATPHGVGLGGGSHDPLPDADLWPGLKVAYPHGRAGSILLEVGSTLAASVPMLAAMFSVSERRVCQTLGHVASRRAARGEASEFPREFLEQTLHRRDGVVSLRDTAFHTAEAIRDVAEYLGDGPRWASYARDWAAGHEVSSACRVLIAKCERVILERRLDLADMELSVKVDEVISAMEGLRAGPTPSERAALIRRLEAARCELARWLEHLEVCDAAEIKH